MQDRGAIVITSGIAGAGSARKKGPSPKSRALPGGFGVGLQENILQTVTLLWSAIINGYQGFYPAVCHESTMYLMVFAF